MHLLATWTLFWRGLTPSCPFYVFFPPSGRREGLHKRLARQEVFQDGHQEEARSPRRPENSSLLVSRPPPSALPPAGRTVRLRPRPWWPSTLDQTSKEDKKWCTVIGSLLPNSDFFFFNCVIALFILPILELSLFDVPSHQIFFFNLFLVQLQVSLLIPLSGLYYVLKFNSLALFCQSFYLLKKWTLIKL